jgi:predicted permease
VLGLVVSIWTSQAILSLFDVGPTPFRLDLTVNATVLAFTVAVSAATGIGFALVPALKAVRSEALPGLKASEPVGGRWRRLTGGRLLVASQVALCVVLLVSAGLLARSLRNLRTFDAGFDRERVVLTNVNTSGTEFSPEARMALYASLLERLSGKPGVSSVSISTRTPIDFSSRQQRIDVPGFVPGPDRKGLGVSTNAVAPDYFQTFGIRRVRGRGFTNDDGAGTPQVAVVSAAMARTYFGDSDPIGRTVIQGGPKNSITIIGVVEDVRHERLTVEEPPRMFYTPLAQTPSVVTLEGNSAVPETVTVAIRTTADARALMAAVREEVRGIDRNAVASYERTFEEQLDAAVVRERLLATLSAAFGAFALVLACVGLYGTMSYSVARRSREIGIRMALGAVRTAILRQVLREGLMVSAVGVVVGALVAFGATRVMAAILFQVSPRDPLTLASVVAILLTTALAAGYLPARRAATVDPAGVLKGD